MVHVKGWTVLRKKATFKRYTKHCNAILNDEKLVEKQNKYFSLWQYWLVGYVYLWLLYHNKKWTDIYNFTT